MTDSQIVDQVKWAPLASYEFWSTHLQKVVIEDTQIPTTASNAIYSSIQNEISAPKADYAAVIAYFYSTKECQEYGSAHICECEG